MKVIGYNEVEFENMEDLVKEIYDMIPLLQSPVKIHLGKLETIIDYASDPDSVIDGYHDAAYELEKLGPVSWTMSFTPVKSVPYTTVLMGAHIVSPGKFQVLKNRNISVKVDQNIDKSVKETLDNWTKFVQDNETKS